jgi:hypothetical protein
MLNHALEQVKTVAIGGHVRPDGDCVGSCMGVYQYIKTWYPEIEVDVYLEDIPESFSTKPNPNYSFNCGMNLNVAFQYDNGLNLIKDRSYSDFGMCEDPE